VLKSSNYLTAETAFSDESFMLDTEPRVALDSRASGWQIERPPAVTRLFPCYKSFLSVRTPSHQQSDP